MFSSFAASLLLSCCFQTAPHTFAIGDDDFLLDGKPFIIRSGEMHAARVPREYWRHRLQMIRAMGCNTVCAYLFWNQHEPRPGEFTFDGWADAAEYCRIAQEVGLWVILRPGPYSCAEWDFGGLPWWLLKTPDIKVRTRDPHFMDPARRYLLEVGKQLAPLQITNGGPIIMVQVENEYGSYGSDKQYIGAIRDCLKDGGFNVPFFTCDGASLLKNDARDDIFCVANFGNDPAGNFKVLREFRPKGPLMCGEYYPGWFDSWGKPHHTGDTKRIVDELGYMLEHRQSFSIYMVHGGTSFGFTAGANSPPFSPQTTSYDYDAPIDEAGRATPKFHALRELFAKHLNPGETIPNIPPAPNPIIPISEIKFLEAAALFDKLPAAIESDALRTMEPLDQSSGCVLYRTTLPELSTAALIGELHDFGQVFVDGERVGVINRCRRKPSVEIELPAHEAGATFDILVEAFGRVNFGGDIHDRKGICGKVALCSGSGSAVIALKEWQTYKLPLDAAQLAALKYSAAEKPVRRAAFYRATFDLTAVGDTFLDLRSWEKGVVWVNGHNLGRYWNIGPTQTTYLPGCWLKVGRNEVVVLDITGGVERAVVSGLREPIMNEVRPDTLAPTKLRKPGQTLNLDGQTSIASGELPNSPFEQTIKFAQTPARYACFEALSSHTGDAFTTIAELDILTDSASAALSTPPIAVPHNQAYSSPSVLPRQKWIILYADSEELDGEDGSAVNVLDSDPGTFWHTQWESAKPPHPHQIVIDLGRGEEISGVRILPRQDSPNGRIKGYRIYLSTAPFPGL